MIKKPHHILSSLFFLFASTSSVVYANEQSRALTFEPTPYQNSELFCENDNDILPEKNDFELVHYSIMSSEEGERYAFITLHNTSSGQRLFNQNQLLAVLGDCSRKHPFDIEKKFVGDETISLQVKFGFSRFPILKLITTRD